MVLKSEKNICKVKGTWLGTRVFTTESASLAQSPALRVWRQCHQPPLDTQWISNKRYIGFWAIHVSTGPWYMHTVGPL